jgi:hypothetical protein
MRIAPALAACILLLSPSLAAAPDPIARAADALAPHTDGFGIYDASGSAPLDAYWAALTDKALAHLNGGGTAETLAKAMAQGDDASADAVTLAPGLVGLSLHYGEMGDVLLLARRGARFAVAWDAAKPDASAIRRFPVLAAWTPAAAAATCRSRAKGDDKYGCGALSGGFLRLPADRAGHVRFAIDATYAQAAGETVAGQLSLWSWDGKAATPLLAKTFIKMIEGPYGASLAGDVLTVREKGDFKTFFTCGACEGRTLDWSVRIGPDGLTDLGEKSFVPELDAVDGVLDAIRHGAPTAALASDQVVAVLRPFVRQAVEEARNDPNHFFSLVMLETHGVTRRGGATTLCFSTDTVVDARNRPFLFAIRSKSGHLFLEHAAPAPSETCPA